MSTSKPTIIQPDPGLRRRMLWGLLIFAVLGAWSIYVAEDTIRTLSQSDDPQAIDRMLQLIQGLLFGLSVVMLALVLWLLWTARCILQAGQFPLPGQKVLRPTPLRTGSQARRLAWIMVVIGVLIILCHALAIYFFLRLLQSFPLL